MTVPPRVLAALAAAMAGVLVGAATVATRYAIDQTSPASLALLRYGIGVLCLLPFVLASPRVPIARRDMIPIALLGIGQFGVLVTLLNFGMLTITAGRAALIFATFPLMTMLLAAAAGREALTGPKALGVCCTILGVAFVLGEKVLEGGTTGNQWTGILAVFGSALCGAVCSILYRPYLERYPTLPVSLYAMLASVGFLFLLALAEGSLETIPGIDPPGWMAVVFIGLASAVGYYLWLWALAHTTPTKVAVFLSLSPLSAALLGSLLLDEAMTLGLTAGLACVAGGLWLAHRPSAADRDSG